MAGKNKGKRISKRTVDALKPPKDKDRAFLWDSGLAGFGVGVMASGTKVYVIQYRQAGRSRRMKLGEHGALTPDEARKRAKELLGQIATGKDPIEERRAKRAEQPFKEIAAAYMRLHVKVKCGRKTFQEYDRSLKLHILPAIGGDSVSQVSPAKVARLHAKMADTPFAANRCIALIDAIWNWAVDTGEINDLPLPTKDIDLYAEEGRERYLTLPEMKRLGHAMHLAETTGLPWIVDETSPKAKHLARPEKRMRVIDPNAVAAIRLLILTGTRLREILHARWDWVDWERGILFLPKSKAGKKPVYLSQVALLILSEIPRVEGNPHIFPGDKPGTHRSDLKRPWQAIRHHAGLAGEGRPAKGREGAKSVSEGLPSVRIHDLRHSFASVGVGGSLGLPMVGKLLGHKSLSSTQRYAHLDTDPLHKSANLIGSKIIEAMALPSPETKS